MDFFDIQMNQAANCATDSYEPLVELLESIEHFLNRLDIYTRMPSTPTLDDIVVKIIVELLSTLGLATKELRRGRSSESALADVLPHSTQRSQICKEGSRRERNRGGPASARATDH